MPFIDVTETPVGSSTFKDVTEGTTSLDTLGAPGTTTTDILEGTTTEESVAVKDPKGKNDRSSKKTKDIVESTVSFKDITSGEVTDPDTIVDEDSRGDVLSQSATEQGVPPIGLANKLATETVDLLDIPLSGPAWLGGMASGLIAANIHSADPRKPAGLHFGAALEVSEKILETYGNPLRKALEGSSVISKGEPGEPTSNVAAVMEKVGELFKLAGNKVTEFTGSQELGAATEFGSQVVIPVGIGKVGHVTYKGVKKAGATFKEATVKETPPIKERDPNRIQPDESIGEVIQRKVEREALAKKVEDAEVVQQKFTEELRTTHTASELANKARMAEFEQQYNKEQGIAGPPLAETGKTRDTAMAYTDKEGVVTVNAEKVKADLEAGFPYIFNADTPTGKQKAAVFEQINITKEEFTKAIPDIETYTAFLKAHEASHLKNGDRAVYPRTAEGKADLMHPEAIAIEARATLDALKAINKPTAKEIVTADVFHTVVKETVEHPITREEASRIIEHTADAITAETRLVENFAKEIEHVVPEVSTRNRVARSLEKERGTDALLSDVDKKTQLEGTGKPKLDKEGKTLPYIDRGMIGALEAMETKLAKKDKPGKPVFESPEARVRYQEKAERLKAQIEAITKRPSEDAAIGLAKRIETYLADIGNRAVAAGVIDALRNNYVAHVLDFRKSTLSKQQQASLLDRIAAAPKDSKLVRDFSQKRTYEFLRDLEALVEGTGVVVLTDIASIVRAYGQSMQTAILHKNMIDHFQKTLGPDGKPWMMKDGPEAKNLKYVSFEGKGTANIRDMRVHPDLADSMGFMFRQTDPNVVVRTLGGISHLTKAMNVVASFFHAKSLIEAGGLSAPMLTLKEIATGYSGARAAIERYHTEGAGGLVDLLVREGGLMIKVEDVQRTIVLDTSVMLDNLATQLATKTKLLDKGQDLKLTQHIVEPFDKVVLGTMNKVTWEYLHTGQKINVAIHKFEKMKRNNPDMSDAVIAKEVSANVNNTFGGVNWLQVANDMNSKFGRAAALKMAGIAGREWAQIVMFAPDWTVSTLRAVTTALPKEILKPQNWEIRKGIEGVYNPRTQGDLARRYVIHTAIAWATILNGINLAMTGHSIWENKDPTRIEQEDGTSIQAAKHSMEAMHWLMAPDKTLGNKLGFWPKSIFVGTTGIAYPSPTAPKLKDTSALGRAKAIGLLAAPFQVSSAIQAPEGEKLKRAALSSIGLPVYGVSKENLKKAQAKGRKEAAEKRKREKYLPLDERGK